MSSTSEAQAVQWRPSFPEIPSTLRIIPVSGMDAINWTMAAVRCISEPGHEAFARGTDIGMNAIKGELLLPVGRELPVEKLLNCFSTATANRRMAKLSRILHLMHSHPGAPQLHKGLRFVTASLWASYAMLNLEGEEGRLQAARIMSAGNIVWTTLGWKVTPE
jgi:hypothetical protein